MLLDDDVVTEREAKSGALAGRLGGEERIEHLFLHLRRDAGAIVADADLDPVTQTFGRGSKRRLETFSAPSLALGRGIEAVADEVEQDTRDLLRKDLDFA